MHFNVFLNVLKHLRIALERTSNIAMPYGIPSSSCGVSMNTSRQLAN
jgi:hypothetical protein